MPRRRQVYDQYGFYSDNGCRRAARRARERSAAWPDMGFGGFDFSDVFTVEPAAARSAARGRGIANGWPVGQFPGYFQPMVRPPARRAAAAAPEKGSDLEYGLNIDFWQAIKGTQVRLNISRQESCPVCGGTATRSGANTVCPECNGSGSVTQQWRARCTST